MYNSNVENDVMQCASFMTLNNIVTENCPDSISCPKVMIQKLCLNFDLYYIDEGANNLTLCELLQHCFINKGVIVL